MTIRKSGVLLPISSLPSPYGIGDLGPRAYRFADFLARAGQTIWQILPINPISAIGGNSPYQSLSAFAFNTLLISPEQLVAVGLLDQADIEPWPAFPEDRVDYRGTAGYKSGLFDRAYARFRENGTDAHFGAFCDANRYWLDDYALFVALKEQNGGRPWNEWAPGLRDRDPEALERNVSGLGYRIERERFLQYVAFRQWSWLKRYCRQRGIQIIGDIPIYVTYDSADVWANPELFKLGDDLLPSVVAGVPGDYFNPDGQLWGNPVYDWDALRAQGYRWWIQRVEHTLSLVDQVRIDHFRGFVGYWEVPASEKTAKNGYWVGGPGADFFTHLLRSLPCLPFIAEDLGFITAEVRELMQRFSLPGMRLLIFGFLGDPAGSPFSPHHYPPCSVAYTGTHDTNTVRGWFEEEATEEQRRAFFSYSGREVSIDAVHWEYIRLIMMSVAETAVIPMQDLLGLGAEARMNRPGIAEGNWEWRVKADQVSDDLAHRLSAMAAIYGRA
ncbi:4-alpha-glucanotransferase [Methanoculleus taiwanensis]|uniref:4-alpha-glucanotransferase n=1 Tax=Methanoculleus taiwanensis TaxID=1550565 RepID=A0A498GZF3_9EURY|nr:4-alpha-glucanotransferase [Methanoculleus taiwanensis]RXE55220.1 4-alpha-glucanotransferase [Methanoculleus taiwanensis]